jgi:hypothetical protein
MEIMVLPGGTLLAQVYLAASRSGHSPGRLHVHDHVRDLPVLKTQRLLYLMGDGVAFFDGGARRDLHVKVHVHVRLRPTGADGVATVDARHGAGHGGDLVCRQARGVAERVEHAAHDAPGSAQDDDRHQKRDDAVGLLEAELHDHEAGDHAEAHGDVAERVAGVGDKHLAAETPPRPPLPGGDEDVDRQGPEHDGEGGGRDLRGEAAAEQTVDGALADGVAGEDQEHADQRGRERLELGVTVRMLVVGRARREPHAHEAYDVGRAVEHGVEAVGLHGRGMTHEPVHELRRGHRQVEEQHDPEDVADASIAIWGRSHGAPRSGGRRGYGRGTSPTRSRTLASVRAAMASARSAPVLSTPSV